jgi:hypothetical protein
MTMEQTIRSAARLRQLTDDEFGALRRLIETGEEPQDGPTLAAVCEALADCADVVRAEDRPTTAAERGSHTQRGGGRVPSTPGPRPEVGPCVT